MCRLFHFPILYCNNECLHCLVPAKPQGKVIGLSEVTPLIKKGRKRFSQVSIGGGEPTLWASLLPLIRYCKNLHFNVQLHSNCRKMSDEAFALRIVKTGIDGITVPLHAHTSTIHDAITRRKGSFLETIRGIRNLQKCGFENIHVMVVVQKLNYRILPVIAEFLCRKGIQTVSFDATVFTGAAVKNFNLIAVRISKAAAYLQRALSILSHGNVEAYSTSFPFCVINRPYWRFLVNTRNSFVITNLSQSVGNNSGYRCQGCGTSLAKVCASCKARLFCPGTWYTYYDFFGEKEFKPLKTVAMADIVRAVSGAGIKNIFGIPPF
ncbi:MAG: radical SAM protein [Candidatus Omnitrophica bacterium]|nr:radical SAM protein [Candidatus Omnitrophota bacterium]